MCTEYTDPNAGERDWTQCVPVGHVPQKVTYTVENVRLVMIRGDFECLRSFATMECHVTFFLSKKPQRSYPCATRADKGDSQYSVWICHVCITLLTTRGILFYG